MGSCLGKTMGLFMEVNFQPQPVASAWACFMLIYKSLCGEAWWCPTLWHLAVGETEKLYSSKQPNQLVWSPLKPWGRFVNSAVIDIWWKLTPKLPVPLKIPLLTLKWLGYGLAKMMKSKEALHGSEESQMLSFCLASEGPKGDVGKPGSWNAQLCWH